MTNHLGFDLGRADPEAFGLDHLVAAGYEIQVSFFVALDLVAAEHQRFAGKTRMGPENLGGRLRIAPVAFRYGWPAMYQLADYIRRTLITFLVEHKDLRI